MSENEMLNKAFDETNGIKRILLIDCEDGSEVRLTIDEIIERVNSDRSDDFIPYDHNDWVDGVIYFDLGMYIVFEAGQKFWWVDSDGDVCSKFVTLIKNTKVDDIDDIIRCVDSFGCESEYPISELRPIIDTDNRPYKQIGNYWIYLAVTDEGEYSYFVTDLDGNELRSFSTPKDAEQYIEAKTATDAVKFYVIQQFIDENTDEVLYWNNQIGFVSLGEATSFTEDERNSFTNPDNTCWVQLPKLPR